MPRCAAWAIHTPSGDVSATWAALGQGQAQPGRLSGDFTSILLALGRQVLAGRPCDLVLLATTKADLPRWLEALPNGGREGGPGALAASLGTAFGCPAYAVSAACASGPIALAEGARALRQGGRQRILVLGGDRLAPFITEGFAALGAVDSRGAHPFDAQRAGIALGETAAAVLLEDGPGPGPWLQGWGQTLDAAHLTAPAREGVGLGRACREALTLADVPQPGLIIAHGTGTRANDAAEMGCYVALGAGLPVTGWKGGLGHSLGPSGLTEVALACHAITTTGEVPGILGLETPSAVDLHLLPPGFHHARLPWLSPNAGFGGMNGAVVLGDRPPLPLPGARRAQLVALADQRDLPGEATAPGVLPRPTARQVLGHVETSWGRMDSASRILTALAHRLGPWPAGTGVVLGTEDGCRESDQRFEATRLAGTPEPQAFAYTLPSTPVGEASIRLSLTGPGQVLLGADDDQLRRSAMALVAEGAPAVLVARIDTGGAVEVAWAERWDLQA